MLIYFKLHSKSFDYLSKILFLVKLNSEFSGELLEEVKATSAWSLLWLPVAAKKKGYFCVISLGQLSFDGCSQYGHSHHVQGDAF